jgi:hypothetical protein
MVDAWRGTADDASGEFVMRAGRSLRPRCDRWCCNLVLWPEVLNVRWLARRMRPPSAGPVPPTGLSAAMRITSLRIAARRGRPSGTPAARVVPRACDQPPLPGEQRRRSHHEHLTPLAAGHQSRQCREPQPVARLVTDPADLAAQDRVLVPQHQELVLANDSPEAVYELRDIRTVTGGIIKGAPDGRPIARLLGCPPCQGWSAAGRRDAADRRNSLLKVTVSPGGERVFVTGGSLGATSGDYATAAYYAATGTPLWVSRYKRPPATATTRRVPSPSARTGVRCSPPGSAREPRRW